MALNADSERLRQVVANLIDNAIKYSPGGGRIELRVSHNGATGLIQVADNGLGIPAHEHQRIFEKFYRVVDPAEIRARRPTGLGRIADQETVLFDCGHLVVFLCLCF